MANRRVLQALTSLFGTLGQRQQEKDNFTKWLIQSTGALPEESALFKAQPATDAQVQTQREKEGILAPGP